MVSILVLVDVGLRQAVNMTADVYLWGFNPCFSGCWSATHKRGLISYQGAVSILVLVDVGLRPAGAGLKPPVTPVSILVLVDVGLRLVDPVAPRRYIWFQSLF